jgi:hypothetical protein
MRCLDDIEVEKTCYAMMYQSVAAFAFSFSFWPLGCRSLDTNC